MTEDCLRQNEIESLTQPASQTVTDCHTWNLILINYFLFVVLHFFQFSVCIWEFNGAVVSGCRTADSPTQMTGRLKRLFSEMF